MLTAIISSLHKIFPDEPELNAEEISSAQVVCGEVFSFQLALLPGPKQHGCWRVRVESQLPLELRQVEAVPVRLPAHDPDDNYLRTTPGLYPDLLRPLDGGDGFRLLPGQWRTLWATVRTPADWPAGVSTLRFHFQFFQWATQDWSDEGIAEFQLEVLPQALPPQKLWRVEWLHADCIAAYYRMPVWSEEHWEAVENFAANAARHGINILYTPLWTPPLDTAVGGQRPTCQLLEVEVDPETGAYRFGFDRLGSYLDMGERLGFQRFAMSHLFTQWGAAFTPKIVTRTAIGEEKQLFGWHVPADDPGYATFLRALFPPLLEYLRQRGLAERCYFSVSDEPRMEHVDSYRRAVELVRPLLEEFPAMEALSDFDFYQLGLVTRPIPANNHIEPFRGKVEELWTYYCVSQDREVPNRFMAMPSARNRIMGVIAYVYELAGFLQWGFNFYYTPHSKALIDPFASTDSDGGFPAGDPFLVYPGPHGEPQDSIRNEVFYDGLQDLRALQLLERAIGRSAVLEFLHEGVTKPITMTCYPTNSRWLDQLRPRIYERLCHID